MSFADRLRKLTPGQRAEVQRRVRETTAALRAGEAAPYSESELNGEDFEQRARPPIAGSPRERARAIGPRLEAAVRTLYESRRQDEPELTEAEFAQDFARELAQDPSGVSELVQQIDPHLHPTLLGLNEHKAAMSRELGPRVSRLTPEPMRGAINLDELTGPERERFARDYEAALLDSDPQAAASRVFHGLLDARPDILRASVPENFDAMVQFGKQLAELPAVEPIDHGPANEDEARRRMLEAQPVEKLGELVEKLGKIHAQDMPEAGAPIEKPPAEMSLSELEKTVRGLTGRQ